MCMFPDSCKRRKVKCDGEQPCASCRISETACCYTVVPQKRGRVPRPAVPPPSWSPVTTPKRSDQEFAGPSPSPSPSPRVELNAPCTSATASDHQSPTLTHGASPSTTSSSAVYEPDAEHIRQGFAEDVSRLMMIGTVDQLVSHCIDLFMQYIFPNTPVCHEPMLRAGAATFKHLDSATTLQPTYARTFTLVTALCALVLAVAPDFGFPERARLTMVFLRASRAMLMTYIEHDLEHPDWTSLIIRVWHSSATQNVTGRNGAAFHYYNEASTLALRLRLYQEESIIGKPPLEAQLLRSNFWQLYLSDKSATVFDDRKCFVTEHVFPGQLTLLERSSPEIPLLDITRRQFSPLLESRFHEGHLLKRQIWRDGANLITAIKALKGDSNEDHLTGLFLRFTGLIDSFPRWLWNPDQYLNGSYDADISNHHRTCFWVQRSSIIMSFHTIKLTILETCIASKVPGVMGLDHKQLSWHQRKMDISRDFLSELEMVPFICLKMQGEPTVCPHKPDSLILYDD